MNKTTLFLAFSLLITGLTLVSARDPDIEAFYATPSDPYQDSYFDIYVRAEDDDGIDKIRLYSDGILENVEYCDGDKRCTVYFEVFESSYGWHTYMVKVYDDDNNVESDSIRVYIRPRRINLCGDSYCSGGETCFTCPLDCGACNYCGDSYCSGGETCSNCPNDCGPCDYCGDGKCSVRESCSTCASDCGPCLAKPSALYTCAQRGGKCCEYGGRNVVDGASDCPSTCFSSCNKKTVAISASDDTRDVSPTGVAIAIDSSFVMLVILIIIILMLIYLVAKS